MSGELLSRAVSAVSGESRYLLRNLCGTTEVVPFPIFAARVVC